MLVLDEALAVDPPDLIAGDGDPVRLCQVDDVQQPTVVPSYGYAHLVYGGRMTDGTDTGCD